MIVVSGLVEVALGGALLALSRYQTTVAWIVAGFFVAIFKGSDRRSPSCGAEIQAEVLSRRDIEVLRLPVLGLSNQRIAQQLVFAESTVKLELKHLYGKLDTPSLSRASRGSVA